MENFSESRHGYDREEVHAHLKKLKLEYETALADQKDRIFELVERVKKLEAENAEYRKKDDEIGKALRSAVAKAEEIEDAAQKRYDAEIQRLRLFHNKWVKYYREIIERYPPDPELMSVERFVQEMDRILEGGGDAARDAYGTAEDAQFNRSRGELSRTYEKERQRIAIPVDKILAGNDSEKRFSQLLDRHEHGEAATRADRALDKAQKIAPMERLGSYIASTTKARPAVSDSGFDINEVLNPSGKLDLGDICRELGLMDEGGTSRK